MAEDYKPQSNPEGFKEFMETIIYKDFINEMGARIEDLRDFLETGDGKKFHETRGAVAFARQVMDIFVDLRLNRLADMEDKSLDKNED